MGIQNTAATIAAITVLAMSAATPVFAKAHNNGLDTNERDIGHISGRDGNANTYLRTDVAPEVLPDAKNGGEVVKFLVGAGTKAQSK